MNDTVNRDYSFTVRLSPAEKAQLEQLAARFGMDKSAAVRRMIQLALPTLPHDGVFTTLLPQAVCFSIQLRKKEVRHE